MFEIEEHRQHIKRFVPGTNVNDFPHCIEVFDGQPELKKRIRVAVLGQTGTGKTSLINTIDRALEGPGTMSEWEGTVRVEDVPISKGITLVDTRGLFTLNSAEGMACVRIIEGMYQHGDIVKWDPEDEAVSDYTQAKKVIEQQRSDGPEIPYVDRIHAVIWVMKATDPRLANNQFVRPLEIPRKWFQMLGIAPVVVITHEASITLQLQRDIIASYAASACGSHPSDVFFISNYAADQDCTNDKTDLIVMRILNSTILAAQRFLNLHPPLVGLTLVTVTTTTLEKLKFRVQPSSTFRELKVNIGRRTGADPSTFALMDPEFDDELVDSEKVLKWGTEFQVTEGFTCSRTPRYWGADPWGPTGHREVEVGQESDEFKFINSLVYSTYEKNSSSKIGCVRGKWPGGLKVRRVIRIQDRLQWESYTNYKNILRERVSGNAAAKPSSRYLSNKPMQTSLLDSSVNEYLLFHGCSSEVLSQLTREGADFRVSNITGMFGAGFYLAENSSKSNWYIPCSRCHLPCRREEEHSRSTTTTTTSTSTATSRASDSYFSTPFEYFTAITDQNQEADYEMRSPTHYCRCAAPEAVECSMLIFRAALGDAHICDAYTAAKYRGTLADPVRKPPTNDATGLSYDSVVAERCDQCDAARQAAVAPERNPKAREIVLYAKHQAYSEYVVVYTRSPEDLPQPSLPQPSFLTKLSTFT
ncbi:Interferon-induced protein 44 [Pelomyxa schiedti]|nr:Interferon-induced protein 44 [Pelomyxa schiedti]